MQAEGKIKLTYWFPKDKLIKNSRISAKKRKKSKIIYKIVFY